jgi:hypothetical protein
MKLIKKNKIYNPVLYALAMGWTLNQIESYLISLEKPMGIFDNVESLIIDNEGNILL